MMSPPTASEMHTAQQQPTVSLASMTFGHSSEYSLTALSMAAEYQALQGNMAEGASSHAQLPTPMPSQSGAMAANMNQFHQSMPTEPMNQMQGPSFSESLNSLTYFLDSEPFNAFQFPSLINTEQPMPFFSPESFAYGQDNMHDSGAAAASTTTWKPNQLEEPQSLSRFGSRFPSLQPEDLSTDEGARMKSIADISHDDRQKISGMLDEFSSVLPGDFKLPTRLALCRYITAYINGFHEHMPFLHIPTMSVENCSIELLLALAAVGAQYTFEGEKGVELFNVSRAIATHRIRRRDARLVQLQNQSDSDKASSYGQESASAVQSPQRAGSISGPLGLPHETDGFHDGEDLMQTAQALLLLMALCTWAKHKEILREALAFQSILATLIRDDGLQSETLAEDISWTAWIRQESIKRTKYIVYGKIHPVKAADDRY